MADKVSTLTTTASPFNVTYETWKGSGYKRYLFLQDRALQTQELNNIIEKIRDVARDVVEKGMGLPSGSLINGGLPVVDGTTVTLPTPFTVYADGEFITITSADDITITGSGYEWIGVTFDDYYYTNNDDSNLADPATNFTDPESGEEIGAAPNYGEAGAYSIKPVATFALNSGAYKLWTFQDGVIVNAAETPNEYVTLEMIERRERNRCGDYSVNPVKCYMTAKDNDESTLTVNTNRYIVWGKEIVKISDVKVTIPHAKEYESVNNESQSYTTGTYEYEVSETPIRDTSDVSFIIQGYVKMTRGGIADTSDSICSGTTSGNSLTHAQTDGPLVRDSLYDIVAVYTTSDPADPESSHVVDYVKDTDFKKTGNDCDWSLAGSEPSAGTSYWAQMKVTCNGFKGTRTKASITDEALTVSDTNPHDLAHNDVFNVVVTNAAGTVTYTEGTDFTITNNLLTGYTMTDDDASNAGTEADYATITWITTPPGAILVDYDYWTHTVEGHYVARDSFSDRYETAINTEDLVTGKNTGYRNYISFQTSTTEKPINATSITYDYNVYRARRDLIEVYYNGQISRVPGRKNEDPQYPEGHYRAMTIAKLHLPPDSADIEVYNEDVENKTMADIRDISIMVTELKEKTTISEAKLDADSSIERVDSEKGTFTDTARDLRPQDGAGVDPDFSKSGITTAIRCNVQDAYYTVPFTSDATTSLSVDVGSSTVSKGNQYIKLNSTLASQANTPDSLKQTLATTTMKINPYGAFYPDTSNLIGPFISITPEMDTWIAPQIVFNNRDADTSNWSTQDSEITILETFFPNRNDSFLRRQSIIGTQQTLDTATTYIRENTIAVTGTDFTASANNISLTFDGVTCALTPTGLTVAGTNPGTVRADADGYWTATFTIPSNIPTGSKTVEATELATSRAGQAIYTANVAREYIQQTTKTAFRPLPPVMPPPDVRLNNDGFFDPVGQMIVPQLDCDIGQIDMFFKTKNETIPAEGYIRNVRDGDPQEDNVAGFRLAPGDISVSTDSSTATSVTLHDVVPLSSDTPYFFAVGSAATDIEIFYAEGGQADLIDSGRTVDENAYPLGDMRSSSSGLSWVIHPTSDLKFYMRPKIYSTTGTLYFDNVTESATSFVLSVNSILRDGCSIAWYYSTDNGSTWASFEPNSVVRLNSEAAQIKVRADFSTTNTYVSPLIYNDVTLHTRVNASSGKYIGRNVDVGSSNKFYSAHICYEEAVPGGVTITPYVSNDDGSTWTGLGSATKTRQINSSYNKKWYDVSWYLDAPTLAADDLTPGSAGSLDDDEYFYVIAATNSYGETLPSTERSATTTAGAGSGSVSFDMTDVLPTGATGFRVYRGTVSGTLTLKYIIDSTPTTWVDDGSDTNASSDTPLASPTARYYAEDARIRIDISSTDNAIEGKVKNIYMSLE